VVLCGDVIKKGHCFVGLYPLIGWKIKKELVYVAEGMISDTGTVMEWCKSLSTYRYIERGAH
jgi:glycerol kinase